MKKVLFVLFLFTSLSCLNCFSKNTARAWLITNIVDSVITHGRYHHEFYPIVAFEIGHDGRLYVKAYNSEFFPVITNKETSYGKKISNFSYVINFETWTKENFARYSKADIYYKHIGDDIIVTFFYDDVKEQYKFTSLIDGYSRFGTVLEIKGYLFDYLHW